MTEGPFGPVPRAFSPYSLGDWIELCAEAGVPHVPAVKVAELERDDWHKFDQAGPHQARLRDALRLIEDARVSGHMLRWDHVAAWGLKSKMGRGQPAWEPRCLDLDLDDPRAFDLLGEFPRLVVPAWQRPWIDAEAVEGYPVEFRAFVNGGELLGVSSYYPQRPLPDTREVHALAEWAGDLAGVLAERLGGRAPFEWPLRYSIPQRVGVGRPADPGVAFSADFIATRDGRLLFLEGGPPHERGAHPCCFRPGEISGVALENRNPPEEGDL